MIVTLTERIWIAEITAIQGSIKDLRERASILEKTAITPEEKIGIGYCDDGQGKVSFDLTKEFDSQVDFVPAELLHLYMGILDLDRRRMVDKNNITLINKVFTALGLSI